MNARRGPAALNRKKVGNNISCMCLSVRVWINSTQLNKKKESFTLNISVWRTFPELNAFFCSQGKHKKEVGGRKTDKVVLGE